MIENSENLAIYRYPLKNLVGDYLRAAVGVGLLITPFFYSFGAHWMITLILGGLLALFASFGVTTAVRQYSQVVGDEHGLRQIGPRPVALPWNEISNVDLRYFSTRREKGNGWLQLKVKGKGGQIKADSNLDDFDGLLSFVATAVTRHELPLSSISQENFQAAGFPVAPTDEPDEEEL